MIEGLAVADVAAGGRTVVNSASVSAREPDPNEPNNQDRLSIPVLPVADIAITERAVALTIPAGPDAQFVITVRNIGPSDASQVMVGDVGLDPAAIASVTPSQGSCTGLICDLGPMAVGDTAQLIVVVRTRPDQAGQVLPNGSATAPRGQTDVDLSNNIAIATVRLVGEPVPVSDVHITKQAETSTAVVGEPLRYTLTVENRGPDATTNALVTDTPDAALSLVSATPSQGTCVLRIILTCELGPLAAGARATVTVNTTAQQEGAARNAASVIAPTVDPVPGNTLSVPTVQVAPAPKLTLTKRADVRRVLGGGTVRYRITVRATGSGDARDVRVCDRLPQGLTLVRAPGSRKTGARVCRTVDRLAAGTSRTFTITARAPATTRSIAIRNTAETSLGRDLQARATTRIVVLPNGPRCPSTGGSVLC